MTWSEIFQNVSIKQPGPSQKKIDHTVLFQGCHSQILVSIKQPGLDIWKKSIKRPVLSFFSNSRSLERPSLIIETLEWVSKYFDNYQVKYICMLLVTEFYLMLKNMLSHKVHG